MNSAFINAIRATRPTNDQKNLIDCVINDAIQGKSTENAIENLRTLARCAVEARSAYALDLILEKGIYKMGSTSVARIHERSKRLSMVLIGNGYYPTMSQFTRNLSIDFKEAVQTENPDVFQKSIIDEEMATVIRDMEIAKACNVLRMYATLSIQARSWYLFDVVLEKKIYEPSDKTLSGLRKTHPKFVEVLESHGIIEEDDEKNEMENFIIKNRINMVKVCLRDGFRPTFRHLELAIISKNSGVLLLLMKKYETTPRELLSLERLAMEAGSGDCMMVLSGEYLEEKRNAKIPDFWNEPCRLYRQVRVRFSDSANRIVTIPSDSYVIGELRDLVHVAPRKSAIKAFLKKKMI